MTKKRNSLVVPLFCIIFGCTLLIAILRDVPDGIEIPKLITSRPEQVIAHTGHTLSYNPEWRIPNWVAYELTKTETLGDIGRAKHFKPDPKVNGFCPTTKSYSNSGFDRGHMAPAADMKWDSTAMRECFYMTNICPQNHNLNQGDWKELEEQVRDWAQQFGSLFIACGPIVSSQPTTIGEDNVVVPDAFYKVCLAQIDGEWRAIGFYFKNEAGSRDLRTYCRSVDEIESLVGIDFFPQLEDSIENKIEAVVEAKRWGF